MIERITRFSQGVISREQIDSWASSGESEALEFKRTTGEKREASRTICAMLNHRGGRVLFGVAPDRRVIGQQVSDHTLEDVSNEIREIDPPVFPSLERVAVSDGLEVLVVTVSNGQNGPYTYRGYAY
jgi:ATP-dependent DNA helicase RecG